MKHDLPLAPQFYVTAPQPCPYIDGQIERKLFTGLQGGDAQSLNDALSRQGFRRSQNVVYRPACTQCQACISVRIRVADFKPSRSQKRILSRNAGLIRRSNTAWATDEQFELFKTYLSNRHSDGGMSDMDIFEFATMVEETSVKTRVIEYNREDEKGRQPLIASCLSDFVADGISMVYSFFDPSQAERSLGKYMILDHIAIAQQLELPYVYLGYWVKGSPKMDYKSRFSALEYFNGSKWVDREELDAPVSTVNPDQESLMRAVAQIQLPDSPKK